jgi:predicted N-acetyltransferase YhbS
MRVSSSQPVGQSTVEIQAHDRLGEPLFGAARALSRESFADPSRTPEQQVEHRDRFCDMGDSVKWIVALDGGEVVGLAVAYQRVVDLNGTPLSLGGIGDVCVAASHRRRGLASRLVQEAMGALDAAGCDVAYLCAVLYKTHLTELYGRAGFVRIPQGHTFLGASGTRYTDYDGMVAPLRSPERFEEIVRQREPFDIGRGNW